MAVSHRIRKEVPGNPRFLTFSCFQQLPLFDDPSLRTLFAEHLADCKLEFGFQLLAWVVMPEHVHLLLVPHLPDQTAAIFLQQLKQPVARRALAHLEKSQSPLVPRLTDSRDKRHFWQRGGGFDRNVRSPDELNDIIRYIHENPVKRGLCARPGDWAWSSARAYTGDADPLVPIDRL